MRFNYSTFILRMELYSDEPFVSRNLDDFGQSAFRVDTGGDHTCFFKMLLQVVADEKGIFRIISRKNSKKIILPKLDRIFKINFPTTCREEKPNLQPSWSEVQNPTSAQLGQKLKITSP